MNIQKAVWILNRLHGFGAQKFKRLCEEVKDLATLFEPETLARLARSPEWGFDFVSQSREISKSYEFEKEFEQCEKENIQIVSLLDPTYPKNLASIYDPPLILYVKGILIPEDEISIAIVGSRHATPYGFRIAGRFAQELAERGVTVVSGFARGIDSEAHRGAVRAKRRTIAVLGCGLDIVYPKEHNALYQEILSNGGALMSEFPFGTAPFAYNFPKRNRIISGLAMGVLVVEASKRSGSLITARLAAEEGREVYAIPGPIDSIVSSGVNELVKQGAKLATCVDDILEDLAPQLRASISSFANCHCEEPRRGDASRSSGGRPLGHLAPRGRRGETIPSSENASTSPLNPTDSRTKQSRNRSGFGATSSGAPSRTAEQCRFAGNDDEMDPVLKLLGNQPLSLDEITMGLNENPVQVRSRLIKLELSGVVKRIFGGRYVRS